MLGLPATLLVVVASVAVPAPPLTLQRIMADPDWIGPRPESPYWADDSKTVYFDRKVPGHRERQRWRHDLDATSAVVVPDERRGTIDARGGSWSRDREQKAYVRDGDLHVKDVRTGHVRQLTRTVEEERRPRFMADGRSVTFLRGERVLVRELASGLELEPADLRFEDPPDEDDEATFMTEQQLRLFDHVRDRKAEDEHEHRRDSERRRADATRVPPAWYLGADRELVRADLSPNGRWMLVTHQKKKRRKGEREPMPVWVTESGEVETREVRPKVGRAGEVDHRVLLLDLKLHEKHSLDLEALPGIDDDPLKRFRDAAEERKRERKRAAESDDEADDEEQQEEPKSLSRQRRTRPVRVIDVSWNRSGSEVAITFRSRDNKDRWIALVDFRQATLRPFHHLRDEAWINWWFNDVGWLPDDRTLYFLTEESGWSHLHVRGVKARRSTALTSGRHVVDSPTPTRDGRHVYYRANAARPGKYDVHRVEVATGRSEQVSHLGGRCSYVLSPDERWLLVTQSTTTRPPELFLQPASPSRDARQLTDSLTDEFRASQWTAPEHVAVPSTHGAGSIHSRLYRPRGTWPGPRPAVVFIHGAGYLQNAHEGWSGYFREFMFHSLLTERGYVVLDMDFRASAGYGRDWRTAIYRNMGGPELEDLDDGVRWLVANAGVDRQRVGAYGGSYGGFLALMALFKEPDLFAAAAALRPVTDWAHYNHGYTSNILNTPELDPEAYLRSSPIEHAEGLSAPLLMCAPMLDDNVLFQDTVRLVQRLIELEKVDWETAIYPVEPHGFREPSSWLDEYRRILELFETHLQD